MAAAGSGLSVRDAIKFLSENTFLGALPAEALEKLAARGHIARFRKDEAIFERDDAGESLLLVLSGRVKIYNITTDAREVVLNFLGPGDVSGEISALDGRGRSASALAIEPTECFVLQRRDILPSLQQNPEALLEIVQILCDKLRATSEIVEDNQRSLRGRAARGLLRLARAAGQRTKEGITLDMRVSQRDFGAYFGMSRENTSRQFTALSQEGILAMVDGVVIIRDPAALTAIAESETA